MPSEATMVTALRVFQEPRRDTRVCGGAAPGWGAGLGAVAAGGAQAHRGAGSCGLGASESSSPERRLGWASGGIL